MSNWKNAPAFPPFHNPETHQSGMTLRDYFAAKAMQGILSSGGSAILTAENAQDMISEFSYKYADAMLKQRSE